MTGLYYEEFQIGQQITTVGRTIAESDIMTFAGLSGDYNQLHTDAEYSRQSNFGQRVAHGLLGLSITSGLAMRTGILEGTVIAFREICELEVHQAGLHRRYDSCRADRHRDQTLPTPERRFGNHRFRCPQPEGRDRHEGNLDGHCGV